jgi:hypothetical protein
MELCSFKTAKSLTNIIINIYCVGYAYNICMPCLFQIEPGVVTGWAAVVAGTENHLEGIPGQEEDTMTAMSEIAIVNPRRVPTDTIDAGAQVRHQVAVEAVASVEAVAEAEL